MKSNSGTTGTTAFTDSPGGSKRLIEKYKLDPTCSSKEAHRYDKGRRNQKKQQNKINTDMKLEKKIFTKKDKGLDERGKRLTRIELKEKGNQFQKAGQANAKPLLPYSKSKQVRGAASPRIFL